MSKKRIQITVAASVGFAFGKTSGANPMCRRSPTPLSLLPWRRPRRRPNSSRRSRPLPRGQAMSDCRRTMTWTALHFDGTIAPDSARAAHWRLPLSAARHASYWK